MCMYGGGFLAVLLVYLIIHHIGFTPRGVAVGSVAAYVMSVLGNVTAGKSAAVLKLAHFEHTY